MSENPRYNFCVITALPALNIQLGGCGNDGVGLVATLGSWDPADIVTFTLPADVFTVNPPAWDSVGTSLLAVLCREGA